MRKMSISRVRQKPIGALNSARIGENVKLNKFQILFSQELPYSWASILQPSPTSLDTPRRTLLIECISIKFPASETLGVVVFVEKCANNLMNYITQIELKQGLFI
jgi:hypothetical protein